MNIFFVFFFTLYIFVVSGRTNKIQFYYEIQKRIEIQTVYTTFLNMLEFSEIYCLHFLLNLFLLLICFISYDSGLFI